MRIASCLAGLMLLTSCSLATRNPLTAPPRLRGGLPAGWSVLTERRGGLADPGAPLDLGAGLTVLDDAAARRMEGLGYTNPVTNPMPDGTPAPGL